MWRGKISDGGVSLSELSLFSLPVLRVLILGEGGRTPQYPWENPL